MSSGRNKVQRGQFGIAFQSNVQGQLFGVVLMLKPFVLFGRAEDNRCFVLYVDKAIYKLLFLVQAGELDIVPRVPGITYAALMGVFGTTGRKVRLERF
jgi:hypothetical protein